MYNNMPDYIEKNTEVQSFVFAKKSIMTADFLTFVESMAYSVIERDLDETLVYPFVIHNCTKAEFKLLISLYKGI